MSTVMRPSIEDLITAARRGQEECLGQLLQTNANYLRVLAAMQMDGKLRARVSDSDVVQETFYEAHRDFRQFRRISEREFVAWLRRILINNLARLVEKNVLADKRDVRREIRIRHWQKTCQEGTGCHRLSPRDGNDSK